MPNRRRPRRAGTEVTMSVSQPTLTSHVEAFDAGSHVTAAEWLGTVPVLALGDGTLTWDEGVPDDVLSFTREPGFRCVVNFGAQAYPLPDGARVLVHSGDAGSGGDQRPRQRHRQQPERRLPVRHRSAARHRAGAAQHVGVAGVALHGANVHSLLQVFQHRRVGVDDRHVVLLVGEIFGQRRPDLASP